MTDTTMRNIPIRNPELIEILDKYKKLRTDNHDGFVEWMHLSCSQEKNNRDWWVGDEYLKQTIAEGQGHEGFPDAMVGYEFRTNEIRHQFFKNKVAESSEEASWRSKFLHDLGVVNREIMNFVGCRNQALAAIYPPNGFIAWHNNANASAWNFIFTYSETGEGCFKYWDIEKQEVVVMQDVAGWQLKAGYFGHYGEPEKLFYHSAETDCWRHTISFCFDRSETSEEFREELIDEISSE